MKRLNIRFVMLGGKFLFSSLLTVYLPYSCQVRHIQQPNEIERVEFFYVPDITRMEISMDEVFLSDTTNALISYYCLNDISLLNEFSIAYTHDNWVKAKVQSQREAFLFIKIFFKNGRVERLTKERLRYFSYDSKNYFIVPLERWLAKNIPEAIYPQGHRISCILK